MLLPKHKYIRSKAIRNGANGQDCTLCGLNDGTTVFCHLNESWAGKSMGRKSDDFGFYGCLKCHDDYDGRNGAANQPATWEVLRACFRTWKRQIEQGIIKIKDYETESESR